MLKFTARDRLKLVFGGSAVLLGACGGGSSNSGFEDNALAITPPPPVSPPPPPTGSTMQPGLLKNSFQNNFEIGAAVNNTQLNPAGLSAEIALDQFNSITPEYELKADIIAPQEGVYNFEQGDRVVDWALANGMSVRGHALLWHEATPAWMLEGTPAQIRNKLETYISDVMDHYRGRITDWDVVNEAISIDIFNGNNGIGPDRPTPWYEAVGNADYIDWAFMAARAADPNARLFLSDYETENVIKRGYMVEILERLSARNIPIDGVGHQFHLNLATNPQDAMAAIDAVDNQFMGLVNHVTELDISCYQDPGSCWESGVNCDPDLGPEAPEDFLSTQAQLLRDIFNGLVTKSSVESVSFWGVRDSDSWLNSVPAERYNYPLLFDRDGNPKSGFHAITDPDYVI